jgi:hypothetical protein
MNDSAMTLPRRTPPPPVGDNTRANAKPRRRYRQSETVVIFAGAFGLYLVAAGFLIHDNIVFPDAISRMANAFYVLFSRDPHLPAMGFVWNPLPSFALLPILPFKSVFPGLVVNGAAGAIQSALSMAGAVAGISVCLRKLRVPTLSRRILVVLFAVQPMILLYAGSGQSEPMLLLFLVLTASALISWTHDRETGHLVAAGVALGLAYMTRYESGAPAMGVAVLVTLVTLFTSTGTWGYRVRLAVNDLVLVSAPFLFAFFLWAASAKILVDEWFPTFGSKYGNSAQVAAAAQGIQQATGTGFGQILQYLSRQTFALAPVWGILMVATLVLAIRRRNVTYLVAPVVFGSVMAFCALVLLVGASFGWLRFQITVIPLTVLLAGSIIATLSRKPASPPIEGAPEVAWGWGGRRALVFSGFVLLAVGLAIPVQAKVLVDPTLNLAREEAPVLSGVFSPEAPTRDPSQLRMFLTEHDVSAYVDQLDPGDGTVLADSAYAFAIITSSSNPQAFVISSDFDFTAAVDDPAGHQIRYILVRSEADSDAVQIRWPTMYGNGAGIATLVRSWDGVVGQWRLYHVNNGVNSQPPA